MTPQEKGRELSHADARAELMGQLRRPNYSGQGLRDAFEVYESAVYKLLPEREPATVQLLNMAKGLEVCARVRRDEPSVNYFNLKQEDYKKELPEPRD